MSTARNRILSWSCAGFLLALALVTLLGGASVQAAESASFVIVVHPSVPDTDLSRQEVSDLFLKKVARWSDRSPVLPVTCGNSEVDRAFSEAIHGRSSENLKKFWQRQIFSGADSPPPIRDTDQGVLDYVSSNPGAVGVVSARANVRAAGVRVVSIH